MSVKSGEKKIAKVEIIIPVYNGEKFIEETVASVLIQSYSDWRLIIVDDGSTDNTRNLVQPFLDDPRVKVSSISNSGVSRARNLGIEESSAKYMAFLDADDVWLPDNLERKVKYLDQFPNIGLVHSDAQLIDGESQLMQAQKVGKSGSVLDDLLLWNGTVIPAPSSILVRNDVIQTVGGFDTELSTAADQEFFFRVASQYEIGRIPTVTWYYRMHYDNMHRDIKRMEIDHIAAYKKAEKNNLFKTYFFKRRCMSNLFFILAGSWWVNANRHPRTFLLLLRSLIQNPFSIRRVLNKFIKVL